MLMQVLSGSSVTTVLVDDYNRESCKSGNAANLTEKTLLQPTHKNDSSTLLLIAKVKGCIP